MTKKQVAKTQNTDIAEVDPELAQALAIAADEETKHERPGVGSISLRSGVMQYMGEVVKGNEIDVVVVGHSVERALYTEAFDSDNITPPDCYALSETGVDMTPADNVQSPQHSSCDGCPNDEWGSGRGKGKACGERRRLLVAPASILETGLEGAELAILKVPVTSIKNWAAYVTKLKSSLSRPAWSVVTKVSVVPDPKTQFKVNFDLVEPINNVELINNLRTANGEAGIYTMQGYDMTPPESSEESEEEVKF